MSNGNILYVFCFSVRFVCCCTLTVLIWVFYLPSMNRLFRIFLRCMMFNFSIYGTILLALDVMISLWATYELHAKITTNSLTTNYWFVVCIFFLFSRFHQISFVFTNGWVFYWVTLSSIYRMVLVFVIFSFCSFLFLLYEMIAKAWHKMPLAKSKLLVKVCQQNAIRFQFAFFSVHGT